MANVLSSNGVPATTAFAGSTGTPLVVDTNTGNGYVLIGGVVEGINTTGNAATATNATNATNLIAGGTIASSVTGITQANGDNTTLIATDAFVQAALSYYNTPVAWNGSTDRVLGVGQITQDSFTSATSIPLHIACGDGQIYELEMDGTFTPAAGAGVNVTLNPNNNTYTSKFTVGFIYAELGSAATSVIGTANSFALDNSNGGIYSVRAKLNTSTLTKQVTSRSRSAVTGTNYIMDSEIHWDDATTVWASLGTVIMPNAWTGSVVVKRIA